MQTLTFDFRPCNISPNGGTQAQIHFQKIGAMPDDPPAIRESLPPRRSRWGAPIQLPKERALVATPSGRRRPLNNPAGNCRVRCVPWVLQVHGLGIPNVGEHGDISNDSFHCGTFQKWQLRGPSTKRCFRSLWQVLYLHGPGSNESMAQKQVQAVFKTPGGV